MAPEMPDVVTGTTVESSWGNQIRDRTVQRYADSTERDALMQLPVAGDLAWLDNEDQLTVYTGTGWARLISSLGGLIAAAPIRLAFEGSPSSMDRWSFRADRRVLRIGALCTAFDAFLGITMGDDSQASANPGGQYRFHLHGTVAAMDISSGADAAAMLIETFAPLSAVGGIHMPTSALPDDGSGNWDVRWSSSTGRFSRSSTTADRIDDLEALVATLVDRIATLEGA